MIDLHTHSTASDGFLSPSELLHAAEKIGLEALALTDHDAVSGLDELHAAAAKNRKVEIVNGAELSVFYPGAEMEILALDIPEKSLPAFREYQQNELARRDQMRTAASSCCKISASTSPMKKSPWTKTATRARKSAVRISPTFCSKKAISKTPKKHTKSFSPAAASPLSKTAPPPPRRL